jgi:hypothetical protein
VGCQYSIRLIASQEATHPRSQRWMFLRASCPRARPPVCIRQVVRKTPEAAFTAAPSLWEPSLLGPYGGPAQLWHSFRRTPSAHSASVTTYDSPIVCSLVTRTVHEGKIRKSRGALFVAIVKRACADRGIASPLTGPSRVTVAG